MKNKIKIGIIAGLLLMTCSLTSCLRHDLPAYPLWNGDLITNAYLEYRYNSGQDYWGNPVVAYQRMQVNASIDTTNNTVTLDVTVPPASGSFSDSIRNMVTQSTLWPYFDISTAATMASSGTSPKPGFETDFTKPQTYVITAADGQKRNWTVIVKSFTK